MFISHVAIFQGIHLYHPEEKVYKLIKYIQDKKFVTEFDLWLLSDIFSL